MIYKIVTGYDHFNNYELYQVVGVDNEYYGEYTRDHKEALAEIRKLYKKERLYDIQLVNDNGKVTRMNLIPMTHNEVCTMMGKFSPPPAYIRREAVELKTCVMWKTFD